jgi:hypothetical protein
MYLIKGFLHNPVRSKAAEEDVYKSHNCLARSGKWLIRVTNKSCIPSLVWICHRLVKIKYTVDGPTHLRCRRAARVAARMGIVRVVAGIVKRCWFRAGKANHPAALLQYSRNLIKALVVEIPYVTLR